MLKKWWEQHAGRLEHEEECLNRANISFTIDEEKKSQGIISMSLVYFVDGEEIELTANFPPFYPYFPPEVFAPKLSLDYHQNPISKNLCLLGRGDGYWRPLTDNLASHIAEQLPAVLKAGRSTNRESVADLEKNQSEPASIYFQTLPDSHFLTDSEWRIDDAISNGRLKLKAQIAGESIQGAIVSIQDKKGNEIIVADQNIAQKYSRNIDGRWIRLEKAPISVDISELLTAHQSALKGYRGTPVNDWTMQIIGFVFPEEVKRGEYRDGWIFLVILTHTAKKKPSRTCYVRSSRYGKCDIAERIPELTTLQEKSVVIFGLGCLGATIATELAKNNIGKLTLVDYDTIEAGTTVRWVAGIPAVGHSKVHFLGRNLKNNYPYIDIEAYQWRLGSTDDFKELTQVELLNNILNNADLIIDATGNFEIRYFLAEMSKSAKKPYLCVSATNGGYGGRVFRIRPATEGCIWCLLKQIDEGQDIEQGKHRETGTLPIPLELETDFVQPAGCADPTFTGTSFDTGEVALGGVRLAVSTLCSGVKGAYPDFDKDVMILSLRDKNGSVTMPSWESYELKKHPQCPCH